MFTVRTTSKTAAAVLAAAAVFGTGCGVAGTETAGPDRSVEAKPPAPKVVPTQTHDDAPESGLPSGFTPEQTPQQTGTELTPETPTSEEPLELDPQRTYEQQLPELVNFVDEFWTRTEPGYVSPTIIPAYENGNQMVCGGEPLPSENAFNCGTIVTWDETGLFRPMYADPATGDMGVAIVLAHEWGHYIQNLRQINLRYVIHRELMADCLAGAWAADMDSRGLLEPGDLDEATNALFSLADDAGGKVPVTWTDETAHGTGEQRKAFFEFGMTDGVESCISVLSEYDAAAV
jgi:predicted metalloprotease